MTAVSTSQFSNSFNYSLMDSLSTNLKNREVFQKILEFFLHAEVLSKASHLQDVAPVLSKHASRAVALSGSLEFISSLNHFSSGAYKTASKLMNVVNGLFLGSGLVFTALWLNDLNLIRLDALNPLFQSVPLIGSVAATTFLSFTALTVATVSLSLMLYETVNLACEDGRSSHYRFHKMMKIAATVSTIAMLTLILGEAAAITVSCYGLASAALNITASIYASMHSKEIERRSN